jgi:AcrR family transcriptional regulator
LAQQRERLLAATADAFAREASPSVSLIIERAGVGRNTFYEYFDDVTHALDAAKSLVLRRIEQSLRAAEGVSRTPVERWRALARAWLAFAEDEPSAMLLALSVERAATSSAAAVLEEALARSLETLRSAGVAAPPASADRLLAVAAVGDAFARQLARAHVAADPGTTESAAASSAGSERERFERALVDVAVRVLR